MPSNLNLAIGTTSLQPRFTALDESALNMLDEHLSHAYSTAIHGHGLTLDGTCKTIDNLETILASASAEIASKRLRPDDEQIQAFITIFSIYLGDVFRVEHQGEWLNAHYDELGTSTVCVRSRTPRVVCIEPFMRVLNRLFDGPEYNVADYYRAASLLTIEPLQHRSNKLSPHDGAA